MLIARFLIVGAVLSAAASAQLPQPPPEDFRWVNPLPEGQYPHLRHSTFKSPSMRREVGYAIYLPPGYDEGANREERYPVVYYLHGGRPGGEDKAVRISNFVHEAQSAGKIPPTIYVWVNGGAVSHYNYPQMDSMGEDVFIHELIPHVDSTYRTIADRTGRGLEGFSQGGRGTTRIMFRHPELFISAAPGGPGYETERRISESGGRESDSLLFARGYNTWDLAREYAANPRPRLNILIHVGTAGFNYTATLEYMGFLYALGIPFERVIVPDVPHSAAQIYEKAGMEIMAFHAKHLAR